jgi:hypothetical protein
VSLSGLVGLGGASDKSCDIALYIANRPMFDYYPALNYLQPLQQGEVAFIVAHTSNHWRKVFNVYAKFMVELKGEKACGGSWQCYRDNTLLQSHGHELLLFSPPDISTVETNRTVHIIAGKTYAQSLQLPFSLDWQDAYFAINKEHRVIVCPYLDYRQLSNERITRLVSYVRLLTP